MGDSPFDRVVGALQARALLNGRSCRVVSGSKARARCPAHNDARASLSVSLVDGVVLMNCFTGCRKGDIVAALGLKMADLFAGPPGTKTAGARTIVAEYDYRTPLGVLIAQKVRYSNKQFMWRRPSASGSWVWGLESGLPGLYRRPEIEHAHRVFMAEGEKAVDHLHTLGIVATCPPAGASRWDRAWSRDLWEAGCRELVILADNDKSGEQHAERVAACVAAVVGGADAIRVKVLRLPGLQKGQDVYDWLQAGATPYDLMNVATRAVWWSADAREQERAERRRTLTRERVRRHREARRVQMFGRPMDVEDVA